MRPVTAELRVSQAALCPGHWLLTILPTWEKPRERGRCCQTQLPRNVAETLSWKASRQESDPCTASVHTAFLKQLFTLRKLHIGLDQQVIVSWCLGFPHNCEYMPEEERVSACFGSVGDLPREMLSRDCWKNSHPE